ncbi:4Fe-4S dicluster domain-containing protein, partial [Thermodesulfobacteriota bacterium]
MKVFHNTIKIEDNGCPSGCSICRDTCLERESDEVCSSIKTVHLPDVGFHAAIACNQCGEPACEEHCPTGAISKSKDDGVVRIDHDKCLGCGLCSLTCPYGGVEYDARIKKPMKCDLCDGDPQCVEACPEGIISLLKSREIVPYLKEDQF